MNLTGTQRDILLHFLFWALVFTCATTSASWYYANVRELLEVYAFRTLLQIVVAYSLIGFFVPKILNKGRNLVFGVSVLLFFGIVHALCTLYLVHYLIPTYPDTYTVFLKRFHTADFQGIFFNFNQFFSKALYYAYPCILLMAIIFYKDKQRLILLEEKKKEAELNALKNQLNPHFLFNTLNSLYLLALKKSDKTVRVIENLSHILDYMLYRCDKKYVMLRDELQLITKYIELEQIRYGKRVDVRFDESITGNERIAPLLLLTFVENAFKHGVSEEIATAKISINVKNEDNILLFEMNNSKPPVVTINEERKPLGLFNIKKQLELLYPQKHLLHIEDQSGSYATKLELCL